MYIERVLFPWRILPGDKAKAAGFSDRHFESKKAAVQYQMRLKEQFPNEAHSIVGMSGRFWCDGKLFTSRREAEAHMERVRQERRAA